MNKVPYYPFERVNASHGDALSNAFARVLKSGWFIRGGEVANFEKQFAAFCGASNCVGVGNGLEALSLILKGYIELGRLQPGDYVVVPSNTFIATWLAVKAAGLNILPAEPCEETSLITADSVKAVLNNKVKAIIAVHLYGRLCEMGPLAALAKERNLLLIEDAAQAHGACVDGSARRAGALGDAAGFSFYPGKNLGALGDGGAVVTNDEALAATVRKLANYGSAQKYVHELAGENSRLDEVQAAILAEKLPPLQAQNAARQKLAARYLAEIKNPLVRLPHLDCAKATEHVWHIFAVHCAERDRLKEHLLANGIETNIHYPIPPHLQGAFKGMQCSFPVAEKLAMQELSLPLHPFMTEEEINQVITAVNSFS